MVKYKSLIMALCLLGVVAFTAKPASAVIIDVNYYWYSTGGTQALSTISNENWVSGDISGAPLVKIQERYDSVLGQFQYLVSNQRTDHDTYRITRWELNNPYEIIASSVTNGFPTWSVVTSVDKWTWSTLDYANGADGYDVGGFRVFTTAPRGYVTGKVYFFDSFGAAPASNPTASGLVSGPVPEPASLLLLGSGLLGFTLFGRAKRKKLSA